LHPITVEEVTGRAGRPGALEMKEIAQ